MTWYQTMLNAFFGRLTSTSPRLRRVLWKQWYELLAARYRQQADWTFMNYGYAPVEPDPVPLFLNRADEPDRYSIQLYHHLAGSVDLCDARVLEVGCGRGGGCSYVRRYLRPAWVLGIDYSPQAIAFCARRHTTPGLSFQAGDAEALSIESGAFDTVLNVESSHCYAEMTTFLGEVYRVLRPGGQFLWADLRAGAEIEATRGEFARAGFRCVRESLITANVLRALDLASEQREAAIERLVPRFTRRAVQDFAGVRGTRVYEGFRSGATQYLSCLLEKPGG